MNICFICPEYPPGPHGGVGTFTRMLARALVRAGHSVRVAGVYPTFYEAPAYEEDQGVRVWRIHEPSTHFGWLRARILLYRLVRSWIRSGDCELVESSDSYGWFAGWPKLPVPLVIRAHGSLTYYAHELGQSVSPVGHFLELRAYLRADAWVAVSHHTGRLTKRLFNLKEGPDAVLYNPVTFPDQVPEFAVRVPGRVVFTGTLTRKKGIISLIDAWPKVNSLYSEAELHIFGKDGKAEDGTQSMQHYLLNHLPEAIHGSVLFHGHVTQEELVQQLCIARVAAFPSYSETFGLGPAEAMGCGCPTIYTKLTCGPEIVQHDVDGLLIDPDQPDELSNAIAMLLREDETAQRLSLAGRARVVEDYNPAKQVPANEAFYAELVRSFHGGKNTDQAYASKQCPA
ncbi:MAG TPA: glycosyltransferase family 4 protein [Pyrinomonadaceae bacterium]|nr:glycosyltransferase family 4 protein [Pyrinomonadaceae bacterium]